MNERFCKTLAKDGALRAEIRAICAGPLVDYSGASWDEWFTLAAVAEECAELAEPGPLEETRGTG